MYSTDIELIDVQTAQGRWLPLPTAADTAVAVPVRLDPPAQQIADPHPVSARTSATQQIARDMDQQAQRYLRMRENLDAVLRSARVRHRSAWLRRRSTT